MGKKKKIATECGVVCGDNSEAKVVLGTAIQRLKSQNLSSKTCNSKVSICKFEFLVKNFYF